ncbi:MAG: GIY-YIG nuclease family protein [Verrucomicrobiae bacterium]|nr:GIY-YIG nuclease family protein [Verrucomicrobiae bacterium]
MTPGVYQLCLRLPRPARIRIGRLGAFTFPAGVYVYTGSALGGLEQRLARHQRRRKKLHWHIDYLLRHARIIAIADRPTRRRLECAWNAQTLRLPGARVVAAGFGSSDCDCAAHLVYLPSEEPWTSMT